MNIRRLILAVAVLVVVGGLSFAVIRQDGLVGFLIMLAVMGGFAGVVHLAARRQRGPVDDPLGRRSLSTDVINLASIRVAGLGGLGLVAVCVGIAIALPRVGQTMLVAAAGGLVAGVATIYFRRRQGPLDSSHAQPGGRSVFVEPTASAEDRARGEPPRERRVEAPAAAVPRLS
jgi:hypothetical protein